MVLKRLFDFSLSLTGLVLLLPVLAVLALVHKMVMPGAVFFRQQRVGQYGLPFTLIKFRTMVENPGGSSVSVKGEGRITAFGALLRKYKIDELPELLNVVRGEMSFVGPRPDVPGYADRLRGELRRMLLLKPGITGPATLKYAHEEELLAATSDPVGWNDRVLWPDKVRINLEYLRVRSFWKDLRIIMETFTGTGGHSWA
jgi:lipopolysaccharide/colanic/teichoic acid biosynthesis glycosyltransferase